MAKLKEVTYNIEKWNLSDNTKRKLGKGFTESEVKEMVRGYKHDTECEEIDSLHAYFYKPGDDLFIIVGRDDKKDFYDTDM